MNRIFRNFSLLILIVGLSLLFRSDRVLATSPISLNDSMSRLKANTNSSHDITFQMSSGVNFAATDTIIIDFDENVDGLNSGKSSNFDVLAGSAVADFVFKVNTVSKTIVDVDGDCTGHIGVSDVAAAINTSTGVVTFTACGSYTASSAGATIEIKYGEAAGGTDRVKNPNPTGLGVPPEQYFIGIGGSYGDDLADLAVSIIADDQIAVQAKVNPTISFSIDDNDIGFGSWTDPTSEVRWATINTLGKTSQASSAEAVTFTVSTNAVSGATIKIKDSGHGGTAGLYSDLAANWIDAIASSAVVANTEGYGVYGASSSMTISDRFNNDSSPGDGPIAVAFNDFASSAGPVSAVTADLQLKAAISGLTPAGTYTDTITVICTGNY